MLCSTRIKTKQLNWTAARNSTFKQKEAVFAFFNNSWKQKSWNGLLHQILHLKKEDKRMLCSTTHQNKTGAMGCWEDQLLNLIPQWIKIIKTNDAFFNCPWKQKTSYWHVLHKHADVTWYGLKTVFLCVCGKEHLSF